MKTRARILSLTLALIILSGSRAMAGLTISAPANGVSPVTKAVYRANLTAGKDGWALNGGRDQQVYPVAKLNRPTPFTFSYKDGKAILTVGDKTISQTLKPASDLYLQVQSRNKIKVSQLRINGKAVPTLNGNQSAKYVRIADLPDRFTLRGSIKSLSNRGNVFTIIGDKVKKPVNNGGTGNGGGSNDGGGSNNGGGTSGQTPTPGALLLGSIGMGLAGWLRGRKMM